MSTLLIIDAGHGGSDNGATANGIVEKDYNLKISKYQFERFKELRVPVRMTRITDHALDSEKRSALVRDSGAAHCISNHINSGGGRGAEVIHSIFNTNSAFPSLVQQEFKAMGHDMRRIFSRKNDRGTDYYFMHRETGSIKTYIVEYGFADHLSDAIFLKENWVELAEAVVKAYCEFVDVAYIPATTHNPKITKKIDYPKNTEDWKKEGVEWLYEKGYLHSNSWKNEIEKSLPLWAQAIILKRIYEELKK